MSTRSLDEHIEVTPGVCSGKQRIAANRITVQNIVICHDRMGRSPEEIAVEYDLSLGDVHAALAFYFDHREEIDKSIKDDEAFVAELQTDTGSKLFEKLRNLRGD